jgi:hypothetical protein
MSPKELNFFSERQDRGLEWYQKHFRNTNKVQGEISPSYSKCHIYPDTPRYIHSIIPDVKLIYILREPIARIVSHFSHVIGEDTEGRDPAEILEDSLEHFVNTSRYMAQLEHYLKYFSMDQILVVTAESLRANRQETLSNIFRFIGVDDSFSSQAFEQVRHDSAGKVRRNRLGRAIARYPTLRRLESATKSIVPHRWHPLFAKVMGKSFSKPLLSAEVQDKITALLEDDIAGLKRLTGYNFDEWKQ